MKLLILLGVIMSSLAQSADPLRFEMDKGTLKVELAAIEKEYAYTVKTPADCRATMSIDTTSNPVRFTHGVGECARGSEVVLQIRKDLSAVVVLHQGNLELSSARTALPMLSQMRAVADTGTIVTQIPGLSVERIHNFAGARSTYRLLTPSKLPVLNLRVVTGLVRL